MKMAKRKKKKNMNSKETGLVIGLTVGQYLFDSDDLHYGFWPDDLEIRPEHIKQAQDHHSELIVSTIPKEVHTILDVGCGAGALAKRLLDRGYQADCVSPSGLLTEHARKVIGPAATIIEMPFEQVELQKQYDLILFSESYQYINLERSLEQVTRYLKPDGYMLICDFFRQPGTERGPIGGGHPFDLFQKTVAQHRFDCLVDRDITRETARNYDLLNDLLTRVGVPIWELIFTYGHANYPRLTRIAKRVYRKKNRETGTEIFQRPAHGKDLRDL